MAPRLPLTERNPFGAYVTAGLAPAHERVQIAAYRAIVALDHLDPTTAEVVRLRNARIQGCRQCMGLRDARALRHGATEDELGAALSETGAATAYSRHRAAIELADLFATTPGVPAADVVAGLRAELSTPEIVEAVLRLAVMSNNKVTRALNLDADEVSRHVYDPTPPQSS